LPFKDLVSISGPMSPSVYYFLHTFSVILLTGATLYVVANPQKHKKKTMMIVTGILSLIILVAGSGLVSKIYANNWAQGWLIAKIVLWLGLSALAGMAYRKSKSVVISATVIIVGIALYMVYFKPF